MEKRKITDAIVIHCSATPEGREHNVTDLRAWHLARGFSDVGYHYVVRLDGTVEAGRGEEYVGAHCVESGMNRRSIGVCYVGGMDRGMKSPKDTRTEAQRRSLLELVRQLQKKYGIRASGFRKEGMSVIRCEDDVFCGSCSFDDYERVMYSQDLYSCGECGCA